MDDNKPNPKDPKPIADEALDEAAGGTELAAAPAPPKRKTEQTRQTTIIQDV